MPDELTGQYKEELACEFHLTGGWVIVQKGDPIVLAQQLIRAADRIMEEWRKNLQ
jgi:hypothetical protein